MSNEETIHLRHAKHRSRSDGSVHFQTIYDNYTEYPVVSNNSGSNETEQTCNGCELNQLYIYFVPLMIFTCLVSVMVNVKVLVSVRWIRRPMTPTLRFSLSLAAADTYTSTVVGTGLVHNSLLPKLVPGMSDIGSDCFALAIEALRLSGIIITVVHLLALTGNHYLGILKPLQYASLMTSANTRAVIALLWCFPTLFLLIYFSSIPDEGFQTPECGYEFLKYQKFRMIFGSMFFIPLIVMVVIYGHIYKIIRQHQATRDKFIRIGSRYSGRSSAVPTSGLQSSSSCSERRAEQQMRRNVKAIRTTLYIIGSFLVGWMPATLTMCLLCNDCFYKIKQVNPNYIFFLMFACNTLCILKSLVNPIIYAARMQEIKNANHRMNAAISRRCCHTRSHGDGPVVSIDSFDTRSSVHHRLSTYGNALKPSGSRYRNHTDVTRLNDSPARSSDSYGSPRSELSRLDSRTGVIVRELNRNDMEQTLL